MLGLLVLSVFVHLAQVSLTLLLKFHTNEEVDAGQFNLPYRHNTLQPH